MASCMSFPIIHLFIIFLVIRWHHRRSLSQLLVLSRDFTSPVSSSSLLLYFIFTLHFYSKTTSFLSLTPMLFSCRPLRALFFTPSPNSSSTPFHFTLSLICSKGNKTITSKTALSSLSGADRQTERHTDYCIMPRSHSDLQYISSIPHPHSITTNYKQFNYYGAGTLLFIS